MNQVAQDVRQALLKLELSKGMTSDMLQQLTSIAQLKTYPAGSVLFYEGDYHDRIHVLCHGKITLQMNVACRGQRKILTIGEGELLAWSAMLGDGHMTTTAVSTEETQAIEIVASELLQLCEQDHGLGYLIMRWVAFALSRRLLATRLQCLDLYRD